MFGKLIPQKIGFIALTMVLLSACGGNDDESSNNTLADASSFKALNTYNETLASCVSAEDSSSRCDLNTLPLIGMEVSDPGVDHIMDRVVVSHDWMGQRFSEVLNTLPEQMLPLFRAVTAIVIDSDIRPAYYSIATGAIYLDPAFLWLNTEEHSTINTKEDYRAGFDDPLAFRQVSRYVRNGSTFADYPALTDRHQRTIKDITPLVARMLLHELGHANDLFPPNSYDHLYPHQNVEQAAYDLSEQWVSNRLSNHKPLTSETMFSLAGVIYNGSDPSFADLEIVASEVGDHFKHGGAADQYAYYSQYEDTAMLFETAMMKYLFNADYELAFVSTPDNASHCDSYDIGWGVRNRIGDAQVKQRTLFVTQSMLPAEKFSDFFDSLFPPMEISGDWCLGNEDVTDSANTGTVSPYATLRPYL
ncbi:MAG: hypothetical protein COA42_21685 [Alteromonadaceae bacterium]|nr:MAG: hypothetical protein COA42_21685 [Alteromonadaceae bacterium]